MITLSIIGILVAALISILVSTTNKLANSDEADDTRQALIELQRKVDALNPEPEQSRSAEDQNDEIQQQLTQLKNKFNNALNNQAAQNNSSVSTTNGNEAIPPNYQENADERTARELAQETERTERIATTLDNAMLQEPLDAGWAGIAEAEVGGAISSIDSGSASELYAVHCQSTLCRIEAGHNDETAEMDFTLQLGKLDAFRDAHAFIQRIEKQDGSLETITYISRSGYALPYLAANP